MDVQLGDELAKDIRRLAQEHQSIELELAARLVDLAIQRSRLDLRLRWEALSARQQEVALLLYAGLSDRQVAVQLHITRDTVRTHIGRVLFKMGVGTRQELRNLMRAADIEYEHLQADSPPTPTHAPGS